MILNNNIMISKKKKDLKCDVRNYLNHSNLHKSINIVKFFLMGRLKCCEVIKTFGSIKIIMKKAVTLMQAVFQNMHKQN